jgi:hypothetical protein
VCEINDPGHTCDEYLVLLAISGMTSLGLGRNSSRSQNSGMQMGLLDKMWLKGNIKRFKAWHVAKGFMQREGIDFNETFSKVSCKYSFIIIMALVSHYDLELHQMDIKMTFLNGDPLENINMA